VPAVANRFGSMFTVFFTGRERIASHVDVAEGCNLEFFGRFFNAMLDAGVYLAPSQFEAAFVSAAHTDEDIEATIAAADRALSALTA
jgi:glutamate-1-semialdehyde 2,1-aminomutase